MNNGPLRIKSKAFAFEIIEICDDVRQRKKNYVLTDQLMGSGTSIGANTRKGYAISVRRLIANGYAAFGRQIMPQAERTFGTNCKLH